MPVSRSKTLWCQGTDATPQTKPRQGSDLFLRWSLEQKRDHRWYLLEVYSTSPLLLNEGACAPDVGVKHQGRM